MFRRARFGGVIETQLDLFVRDHRDVLDEVDERLRAYNTTNRDQAAELYGDYVDAVETGTELLDDPARYLEEFNRTVARRLPELALEIENR